MENGRKVGGSVRFAEEMSGGFADRNVHEFQLELVVERLTREEHKLESESRIPIQLYGWCC